MEYYIITGTSAGIGQALALQLLEHADSVVIGISRRSSIKHERYRHLSIDLADIPELEQRLPAVFPEFPDADKLVLINNAGTLGQIGYLGNQPAAHYLQVFNINVTAAAVLMDGFLKSYQETSCSKIILNISSGAGKRPIDGWAAYCASKAALDMLSEVTSLEQRLRKYSTKVYSVSPGVVDTQMQAQIRQADETQFSSVAQFKALKTNQELQDAGAVAAKLIALIDSKNPPADVQIRL
jgi:benzil reductase ((S)-benzoin forming)